MSSYGIQRPKQWHRAQQQIAVSAFTNMMISDTFQSIWTSISISRFQRQPKRLSYRRVLPSNWPIPRRYRPNIFSAIFIAAINNYKNRSAVTGNVRRRKLDSINCRHRWPIVNEKQSMPSYHQRFHQRLRQVQRYEVHSFRYIIAAAAAAEAQLHSTLSKFNRKIKWLM